jgi:DNA-binding response OmpR family regulator
VTCQQLKSFTKLITTTGVSTPLIIITTEGGLSAINADWGITDVILDTAGPAEVDARIRIVIGKDAIEQLAKNPFLKEIRSGEVVIDEDSYTAKIKGRTLDLTFKEFELLKYLAQHPGRVFQDHNCCKRSGVMTTLVELELLMFISGACAQS